MKGGIGKSQITVLTATALSSPPFSLRVAVVDVDEQKSIVELQKIDTKFYAPTTPPFTVVDVDVSGLEQQIADLDKQFDLVFIDAAGKLDTSADALQQEISRSIMYADFLFMPFVAGNFTLRANIKYLTFARQIQAAKRLTNRPLRVFGFVNMYRSRSRANAALIEDLETLKSHNDFSLMSAMLGDYAAFKEADTFTSLFEPNGSDVAKANFSEWLNEFLRIIQN